MVTDRAECNVVTDAPPVITPMMVWQQAQRLIPTAAIGLAPRTSTLVNIQTIMWVATPAERDLPVVTILGRPVSVHIRIVRVDWTFGDDHAGTSQAPGKPYDGKHDRCKTKQCPGYYGHTYTTTGHMTVTAAVTWQATFRAGNGRPTPIPGTLTGPAATAGVLVQEARAVLVPDPTPH